MLKFSIVNSGFQSYNIDIVNIVEIRKWYC